jgi:hypothetical protein
LYDDCHVLPSLTLSHQYLASLVMLSILIFR